MKNNPRHRAFLRTLMCCNCGVFQELQSAHIRKDGGGGTSQKPYDNRCVPLCHSCHALQHSIGELSFWGDRFERAKKLAFDLADITGDRDKGLELILNFRRGL